MTGADFTKNLINAIIGAISSGQGKFIIIDSDGNVISDISLSALRDALKGTDNKDFSTLEADVEDLKGALDSVGTDKIRTSVVDALPESPFIISKVAGTALTGRDWSSDFAKLQNLDIALSTLAKLQRWGRNVEPTWIHGDEITAPAENTKLVSVTVGSGKKGYIYGFFIMAGEANDFKITWTSGGETKSIRIPFSSGGALHYVDIVPLNEGLPADSETEISITNVNAGSSGVVYQARLLIAEV